MHVDTCGWLQRVELQGYRSGCEQIGEEGIVILKLILVDSAQLLGRGVEIEGRGGFNPLGLSHEPRIFQINAFDFLVQSHAF